MFKLKIGGTGRVETPEEVMARKAVATSGRMTKDPKVTLCMILKNEEAHIGRCLESLKGHVDEIVVVDTGSTDKTMEICKSYGARVYEHPWENSFSKARNQAMSYVTTEWILQLDGDEEMDAESAPKIRQVVKNAHNTTTNLIYMTLFNKKYGSDVILSTINTGKIIRMGIGAHYVNRIHNKLVCEGGTLVTALKIYHYGYNLDAETMKRKNNRTTSMLHEQVAEMPDDPETRYYLTIQYLRAEKWDDCIAQSRIGVEKFLEFEPQSQLLLLTYNAGAIAYYHKPHKSPEEKKMNLDAAEELCLKAVEIYPDYLDANSLLSSIYFATKEYDKCIEASKKYLGAAEMLKNDPTKSLVIPMNTAKNEWLVCVQLAINFYEQGDVENSRRFLARSEDCLSEDNRYKASFTMFKYMIMRGDKASLENAEAIFKGGYRKG
jgi:glycosyltransferase involved in cell wall biosynthesis